MLQPLGSMPILQWVIQRSRRAESLDAVSVATTTAIEDDQIAELAENLGVRVFRGSETDVLGRFLAASVDLDAEAIVRICADNPFVDPLEVDRLVHGFLVAGADYGCNHQDRLGCGYADGFGAEIIRREVLERMSNSTRSSSHREHVTLAIHDGTIACRVFAPLAPPALRYPDLRFDVDRPEDLDRLKALVSLGIHQGSSAAQVIEAERAMRKRS
jgi:spore coat polysaccharide biosynthesis protein SpsF